MTYPCLLFVVRRTIQVIITRSIVTTAHLYRRIGSELRIYQHRNYCACPFCIIFLWTKHPLDKTNTKPMNEAQGTEACIHEIAWECERKCVGKQRDLSTHGLLKIKSNVWNSETESSRIPVHVWLMEHSVK